MSRSSCPAGIPDVLSQHPCIHLSCEIMSL
jgi:hypothetical protein